MQAQLRSTVTVLIADERVNDTLGHDMGDIETVERPFPRAVVNDRIETSLSPEPARLHPASLQWVQSARTGVAFDRLARPTEADNQKDPHFGRRMPSIADAHERPFVSEAAIAASNVNDGFSLTRGLWQRSPFQFGTRIGPGFRIA